MNSSFSSLLDSDYEGTRAYLDAAQVLLEVVFHIGHLVDVAVLADVNGAVSALPAGFAGLLPVLVVLDAVVGNDDGKGLGSFGDDLSDGIKLQYA